MLSLNVGPVLKARGIERPYTYLVKAGISRHSATDLIQGKPRVLRLDHIELLCKLLICEPNDLLVWSPDKDQIYPENHPLFNLKRAQVQSNVQELLASMPFKQIKEITQTISDIKKANP
ncbi:helix-turn-helix domain-containing protein [Pedobacter boryungensis]|uniref:Helix-turn-helix transcriptional regulator n=1 Tax=Pedobacter boryungensis TaxID=869962 RepID=A0ABX2DFD3_9SPHI|nr:helix-turn-helix transcriptional regulator [Pedobacter boryungensis]NQX32001.1 helix-turn-helix transcriptional regulator [Pedobacter boryungensis]